MMNNVLKKITSIALAVILGITASVSPAAAKVDSDNTPVVYIQQASALEAYSALCSSFLVDNDGYVTYPDDYAGAWIENNELHIAIAISDNADVNSSFTDSYGKLLKEYDCVVFEKVKYSLNELNALRYGIFAELKKNYSVISHYVDVKENKIKLGFLKYDESKVYDSLKSLERAKNATNRLLPDGESKEYDEDECVDTEASVIGGMKINRGSTSGPGRSIGVCGSFTCNGTTYNGIITAGHNLAVSGSSHTLYKDGSEFGKVSLLMWRDGANGDWACVRLTNGDTVTNKIYGSSSYYTRSITGTLDDLPVGTAVMKYGVTNGYAEATVYAQDVAATDSSGYTINGLTIATLTSGSSGGGDSGGPYYTPSAEGGDSYNFVGVHWGSNTGGGGSNIWFTPYVRFKNWFTVKTY